MSGGGSTPVEEGFDRLLAWAYRGEVSGEALFAGLADAWTSEGRAATLRVLADLERQMALALVPLLRRHSVDGGDDERSRTTGRQNAMTIAEGGWADFLDQFAPATEAALERYRRLRSLAPDPDPVLDLLIRHEEALQAFAAAETRGDTDRSLDEVRSTIARLSAQASSVD